MLHIENYSELKLYLQDKHFQTTASNIGAFYMFDPCRAKNLTFDLFFNNYESVRRRWVKLLFFLNRYNKRNLLAWFYDNIEAKTFGFDPCTNYLEIPRLPVQNVTRQQYEILILEPIPT